MQSLRFFFNPMCITAPLAQVLQVPRVCEEGGQPSSGRHSAKAGDFDDVWGSALARSSVAHYCEKLAFAWRRLSVDTIISV